MKNAGLSALITSVKAARSRKLGIDGELQTFKVPVTFAKRSSAQPFVPRLWASRRVAYLLDEIRLHGENGELKNGATDLAREFGLVPIRVSARPAQAAARAFTRLPFLPSVAEWVEAMSQPAIMDTEKAKSELGWEPQYTGLEALQATLQG